VSDTLVAATLSVIAIAILAPLANHFIVKYRERRPLRAALSVYASPLPALLKTHLTELRYNREAPGPFSVRQLLEFRFLSGYMKLALYNPSKKKLNGVTVTLTDTMNGPLYQIEDGPELGGPEERRILIGDLQPYQTRTLHIWTSFAYVDWHPTRLPILFEITADEFDKRTLKFPFPGYLKSLLIWRILRYVTWTSVCFAVATWLFRLVDWYVRR
jgi:hypothetical protein